MSGTRLSTLFYLISSSQLSEVSAIISHFVDNEMKAQKCWASWSWSSSLSVVEPGLKLSLVLYINQQGRWNNVKPIRLNGTKDSMFGIAVKNIGDINQDGYPGREIDCEMVMIYRLCDCLR